jgi:BlaI family transcriptional regulator, penicillinase repressor
MSSTGHPTHSELEILDILWERGTATVRDVYEEMNKRRPTGYTTVLKLMQIMHEKGLVLRDAQGKAHVFRPKQSQRHTQTKLVGNLLDKAFRGSALSLVQHVLETKPATKEELDEIRRLIDQAEAKAKGGKR